MEKAKDFRIFLVDDESTNLQMTRHQLGVLGYHDITLYFDGTSCLNNLTARPNVVFLDHYMTDMSGFEVLKMIKRFDPNIYVVMFSAQESMMTAVDSLKHGAFDYIVKDENAMQRIATVMSRISAIHDRIEKSKPSIWKKIAAVI